MEWWLSVILFVVILFVYLHIQNQYKTGEDLDIYEYEYQSLKDLQDICQWKQPIVFPMDFMEPPSFPSLPYLQLKDTRDSKRIEPDKTNIESFCLDISKAFGLFLTDSKGVFYSDQNTSEINDTKEWLQWFESCDRFLKPSFCVYRKYDILYGSKKCQTITKYHLESHTYLYVPAKSKAVRIKMSPWKSQLFLDPVTDYIQFEFWSRTNLFESHPRLKSVEILLRPGHILFIPSYWFYSIEFQDANTEVRMMQYTTLPNMMAHLKHNALYYLQKQNMNGNWLKPVSSLEDIINNKDETVVEEDTVILDSKTTASDPSLSILESLKPQEALPVNER